MKTLLFLTPILFLAACQSKNSKLYEEYIKAYNTDDSTTIARILHEDFQYKFQAARKTDKRDFIKRMLLFEPSYNDTIVVLSQKEYPDSICAIITWTDDFDKYVDLPYSPLKQKVIFTDEKIIRIQMDTTVGEKKHMRQQEENGRQMKEWMKRKHPQVNLDSLWGQDYIKYLREYDHEKKAAE